MIDTRVRITYSVILTFLLVVLSELDATAAVDEVRGWGRDALLLTVPDGLKNVSRVHTGRSCTVAMRQDGSLVGWGTLNGSPITIPSEIGSVVDVSVTEHHVAVVGLDRKVSCWGLNISGQCDVPPSLPPIKQVGAGTHFTVALGIDGALHLWGATSGWPALAGSDFVKIAAARRGFLALRADGTVAKWGYQIPTPPTDLTDAIDISCSTGVGLAVRKDGTVVQWGATGSWQSFPPLPPNLEGVKTVRCAQTSEVQGTIVCCAIRHDGSVETWANVAVPPLPSGPVVDLSLSYTEGAVVASDGTVTHVGTQRPLIIPPPEDIGHHISQVEVGERISLAVRPDGSLIQWGNPLFPQPPDGLIVTGQVGLGGNVPLAMGDGMHLTNWYCPSQELPMCQIPPDLGAVRRFAVGWHHVVVQLVDGSVEAFGNPIGGCLDVPPELDRSTTMLAAGQFHSIALREDGTVVPWGASNFGLNVVPPGLGVVSQVACGSLTNTVLLQDGTVRCWGESSYGQTSVPAGLDDVVQVSSKAWFTLALRANGTVVGWGLGPDGETSIPADMRSVRSVGAGFHHSLAIVDDSCVGDLDRDGAVMGADLGVLLTQWGQVGAPRGDINADGVVDSIDLGFLIGQWGPCPE